MNESGVLASARAMRDSGLLAAGYVHLNLDDGFIAPKPKLQGGAARKARPSACQWRPSPRDGRR